MVLRPAGDRSKHRTVRFPLPLRIALFTLAVPGTVAIWLPLLLVPALSRATLEVGFWRFAGLLPILGGALGYAWCVRDFARARGTPAPIDPPTEFVARGLYRLVRNPMYLSVLAVIAGEALLLGSLPMLAYGAAIWLGFHLYVVGVEEPSLRRRFASLYGDYCRKTNRWLPRLTEHQDTGHR